MEIIKQFNAIICKYVTPKTIIFGQNITTGSRISGMTNFLDHLKKKVETINTQNSENTLVGFGLGLALNGKKSIYFCKQLDFILLGVDHIVNTLNSLSLEKVSGSFSIITYIVDSGYEGPQSRFHSLQEIAYMSKANCIYLIFPSDIKYNIRNINKNRFNIFCLSQKYSKYNFNPKPLEICQNGKIFKYSSGKSATIIANGFASYFVFEKFVQKNEKKYDFFVFTNPNIHNFESVIQSVKKTKKLFMFDDSRSKNKNLLDQLEFLVNKKIKNAKIKKFYRNDTTSDLYANKDIYKPYIEKI
jgi:pyruvate/2-oxoglutarate/acetoin dehydrogenase E1 component